MESERVLGHRALEAAWECLYRMLDGATIERRSDLLIASCPTLPIPQFNGPWVIQDSAAAVAALPDAIEQVDASGARPWVQTRSQQHRAHAAAVGLGLSHVLRVPGMALRADELIESPADIEIALVGDSDVLETNDVLALAFDAPRTIFEILGAAARACESMAWYLGRVDGVVVATALGCTVEGVTGVFDVATQPAHRGRGYGAALTSRVLRDGFEAGSRLAFLQSSDLGHGIYRRLGFRAVEEYVLLTRP